MMNPLLDKEFLKELDHNNLREVYVKIISLNKNEEPVEEISGKASQGTLSIDGSSAIRRTCSLTIIADRVNINEYYWSFCTKFKLYIGLKVPDDLRYKHSVVKSTVVDSITGNVILNNEEFFPYKDYPDIIWFPQGIFLITDFKINLNTNGTDNIYITGKDKMALLNGELGGVFPHATDVGTIEEYTLEEDETISDIKKTPLTIKNIIREMIHKYGNEPMHNIVINDLDDNGLEVIDYLGDNDIYLLKNVDSGLFESVLLDGNVIRYDSFNNPVLISSLSDGELDSLSSEFIQLSAKRIKTTDSILDRTFYTVVKCSYGSVVGYRTTDFTYPADDGELIMNVGETITQALDKICQVFGDEYEYFYNLDGQFVFQKKLIYINTSWNSLKDTWEETAEQTLKESTYVESSKLVSQVQYSFIGNRMTTMFQNNPNIQNIKNDYAIWGKKKTSSDGKENQIHMRCAIDEKPESYTSFDGIVYSTDTWDWRELIYQMAVDYYDHNHDDDYEIVLKRNNPTYPFGRTGYEPYYEDMLGFWRLLYNPASTDNETYKIIPDENDQDFEHTQYWNRNVFTNPASLLFWFDFLDGKQTNLGKYSVAALGDRTKTINSDDIKAIYYGETPNMIFISKEKYDELQKAKLLNDGYQYIILPTEMEDYFNITKKSKSAQDELDNLIYQYAYCNESITITSIPIYHLNTNMRISAYDEKSKINGEYIVNKITVPLNYNGTMQIMATKAPVRLF